MNRRITTALIGVATSIAVVGGAVAGHAIVRGSQVSSMSANPGAVSLASPGMSFLCSAERIGKRWVLTARHCVELKPDRVYTNSLKRGSGDMARVKRTIVAPKGDMALLELASSPPGPIMPYSANQPPNGALLNMYGWGMTSASSAPSTMLKTATGTLSTLRTNPFYKSGKDLIIRGKSGSPWKGDSGGPVLYRGTLVGTLSHSSSYGKDPNSECGYTAVFQNAAWIQKNTGIAPGGAASKPAPSRPAPSGTSTAAPEGPSPRPTPSRTKNPRLPRRITVTKKNLWKVMSWSKRKPVLIDVGATWCSACKTLKPVIRSVNKESNGSWILAEVDGDRLPEVKKKYSVTALPTVIPIKNGKEVSGRFVGSKSASYLRSLVKKLTSG